MKTIQEFKDYVHLLADDIFGDVSSMPYSDEGEMLDACLEVADETIDGCRAVVYYSEAWSLVEMLRFDMGPDGYFEAAEARIEEMDLEFDDLDKHMQAVAYWALYDAVYYRLGELVDAHFEGEGV